ncbi:MAG: hypothetical protein ACYDH4_10180 [Candidatus Cryosericum sp.]
MKTTITLEFDSDDAEAVRTLCGGVDICQLLRDAFGEFVARREPAEEYVLKRYDPSVYPGQSHGFKVRQVQKRNKMAELLKRGDVTVFLNQGVDDIGEPLPLKLAIADEETIDEVAKARRLTRSQVISRLLAFAMETPGSLKALDHPEKVCSVCERPMRDSECGDEPDEVRQCAKCLAT